MHPKNKAAPCMNNRPPLSPPLLRWLDIPVEQKLETPTSTAAREPPMERRPTPRLQTHNTKRKRGRRARFQPAEQGGESALPPTASSAAAATISGKKDGPTRPPATPSGPSLLQVVGWTANNKHIYIHRMVVNVFLSACLRVQAARCLPTSRPASIASSLPLLAADEGPR